MGRFLVNSATTPCLFWARDFSWLQAYTAIYLNFTLQNGPSPQVYWRALSDSCFLFQVNSLLTLFQPAQTVFVSATYIAPTRLSVFEIISSKSGSWTRCITVCNIELDLQWMRTFCEQISPRSPSNFSGCIYKQSFEPGYLWAREPIYFTSNVSIWTCKLEICFWFRDVDRPAGFISRSITLHWLSCWIGIIQQIWFRFTPVLNRDADTVLFLNLPARSQTMKQKAFWYWLDFSL